jgi:hypothetical protein
VRLVLAVLATLLFAGTSIAQFNLGTITGTVFDPNGGVVPACKITAVSIENASSRTAETNQAGLYTIASLPAGAYRITAEAPGFQKATSGLTVGVDQTVTSDFHLSVGNVSETVKVTEQATEVAVEKDSHEVSFVTGTQALENLPTSSRSFLNVVTLGPGLQKSTDAAGGPYTNFGSANHEVVVGGQIIGSTTFLQDGVVNMNVLTQTANIVASIESVQEVSVESNGMSAKFPSPGLVNVITKRGTNAIHGTAYDYLQNDALNARSFFATSIPKSRYNQFGANLGGPIRKNKLFAFFDYAGLRQIAGTVARNRVPTADERQGNFQADGIIYDPATYNAASGTIAPFPNGVIPTERINPFASRYLGYFPNPTGPVVGGINYQANLNNTTNSDQYLGRIDYNLSTKDVLYGEIQTFDSPVLNPSYSPSLFGIEYLNSGKNASIQDIHIFSGNLINIARIGYNRSILLLTQQGVGAQDYVQTFGLQNLTLPKDESIPPSVSVTGCCNLGNATNPQGGTQNLFQFADEVNWTLGRHQIFIGAEVDRIQFNGTWLIYNGGLYNFNGQYTSNHLTGSALKLGPGLADFMLGYPSSASGAQGISIGAFRETDTAGYVQDNWKFSRKLTLNLGLRYEYYQPTYDKWGKASIYDLPTNTNHFGSWNPNYWNFGPRVGLAYAITNNTVIRSGFGIYYNGEPYNFLQWMLAKLPNYTLQSVTLPIGTPVPVTNVFVPNPSSSAETPFTLNQRMPTPYTEQWNFGIQHSFGSKLLATVTYIGSGSHQQPLRLNPNQAVQDPNPSQPTPLNSRRPYSYIGDVEAQYNMANATYEGLQSTLQYRYTSGLSIFANYTWSKSLDLADAGATIAVNGLNAKESSYGRANFDRSQIFNLGYVYELPFGTGKQFYSNPGWLGRELASGWQVSGSVTAEKGLPLEITAADTSNTGGIHTQVADRVCDGQLPSPTLTAWFNTACFVQPAAGRLGSSGRNVLVGPGLTNFDISAFKRFPFGEQRWVQFRTDFFSAFNHPAFSAGQTQGVTDSTYGRVTSASNARVIQMSLQLTF